MISLIIHCLNKGWRGEAGAPTAFILVRDLPRGVGQQYCSCIPSTVPLVEDCDCTQDWYVIKFIITVSDARSSPQKLLSSYLTVVERHPLKSN